MPLPQFAIGKHLTAFTMTPVTWDSGGTITYVTASNYVCYGHLTDVNLEISKANENLTPMNRPYANHVPYETDATYSASEIEKSVGQNKLAAAIADYSHFKITLTRGAQTWTGHAMAQNYKMAASKPRIAGTLELVMFDIGTDATDSAPLTYS
jgi:hypothetical protein